MKSSQFPVILITLPLLLLATGNREFPVISYQLPVKATAKKRLLSQHWQHVADADNWELPLPYCGSGRMPIFSE